MQMQIQIQSQIQMPSKLLCSFLIELLKLSWFFIEIFYRNWLKFERKVLTFSKTHFIRIAFINFFQTSIHWTTLVLYFAVIVFIFSSFHTSITSIFPYDICTFYCKHFCSSIYDRVLFLFNWLFLLKKVSHKNLMNFSGGTTIIIWFMSQVRKRRRGGREEAVKNAVCQDQESWVWE